MTEKTIVIPQVNLQRMVVGIVGATPLLTNRFSEASIASIEDKQQRKAKLVKEARDPEAEFRAAAHMIASGVYGFPAVGIKKSLVAAGGRFADEKMTHLRGALNVMGDLIPITGPAPKMRSDTIRLQGMKSSMAYRPEFSPWKMDVPIMFNASVIGQAQILNLFQIAGFAVGIGAWRPECNGPFGQFTLAEDATAAAA